MKTMLERGAGLLLPVSSIPSPYGIGTMGREAFEFVDFLKAARQKYWQVLPVGPTSYGDSPYQSFSAFAGNPYFIDLETLMEEGLLTKDFVESFPWGDNPSYVDYGLMYQSRFQVLRKAFENSCHQETKDYQDFLKEQEYWLEDYALFMSCKGYFGGKCWQEWDPDIKYRETEAVERYKKELSKEMEFWMFVQFKFYRQWENLKSYTKENGIRVIGDIPIYMALDSADVWAHPGYFQLDENLTPKKVAGVPPDAFSADGQLWGNPLYDWEAIEKTDFEWWRKRIQASAALYDVIRVDHFIGVVQYYSIPYGSTDGKTGQWCPGPGEKLVDVILKEAGEAKIIAEDLGIFVPAVTELLEKKGLPGMRIIEFAFGGGNDNTHLPHNYTHNSVVYGGTHDNETLKGYYQAREGWERHYACEYMGGKDENDVEDLVNRVFHTAYASIASVAIFQVQDLLGLDNSARMNAPSTQGDNWKWRMTKGCLGSKERERLGRLAWMYRRE